MGAKSDFVVDGIPCDLMALKIPSNSRHQLPSTDIIKLVIEHIKNSACQARIPLSIILDDGRKLRQLLLVQRLLLLQNVV